MNKEAYLAGYLLKRADGDEEEEMSGKAPTKEQVAKHLQKSPNPDDDAFHDWSESKGLNTHKAEAKAYELASTQAKFSLEGKANEEGTTIKNVEPKALAEGTKVESEHTSDPKTAQRIALDHLAEFQNQKGQGSRYYTGLKLIEKILEDQQGKSDKEFTNTMQDIDKVAYLQGYLYKESAGGDTLETARLGHVKHYIPELPYKISTSTFGKIKQAPQIIKAVLKFKDRMMPKEVPDSVYNSANLRDPGWNYKLNKKIRMFDPNRDLQETSAQFIKELPRDPAKLREHPLFKQVSSQLSDAELKTIMKLIDDPDVSLSEGLDVSFSQAEKALRSTIGSILGKKKKSLQREVKPGWISGYGGRSTESYTPIPTGLKWDPNGTTGKVQLGYRKNK